MSTDLPATSVQLLRTAQSTSNCSTNVDYRCGICCWRPRCLRRAANICAFLVAACFVSCLQAAFSGYIASQVTTLEKRFAVGSSVIGFINGFFEVGYIVSVIFVSYAGGRGHVPSVISMGLFIMATGALFWSLPHFIFPYQRTDAVQTAINPLCLTSPVNQTSSNCVQDRVSGYGFLPILFLAQLLIGSGSSPMLTLIPPFIDDHVHASKAPRMIAAQYASSAMGPVFGFALGAFVLQYPDNLFSTEAVLKSDDPNWIGAWWTGFILFSILVTCGGFILLAFPRRLSGFKGGPKSSNLAMNETVIENGVLTVTDSTPVPVAKNNLNGDLSFETIASSSDSPSYYSASGVLYQESVGVSPPQEDNQLAADQVHVPTGSEPQRTERQPCCRFLRPPCICSPHNRLFASPGKTINFLDSVRSLLRNRVYLVVCFCICSEMFMVIGFASFLPKYLEMEYQVTKTLASIIAGGIIVPVGALGIFIGGLILQRFSFHRRDAIKFVLIVNAIITSCIVSFFFLGCKNPPIVGVTVAHHHIPSASAPSLSDWFNFISLKRKFPLSDSCNAQCNCDPTFWSPVCHEKHGLSFTSPCLAGCTNRNYTQGTFTDCTCMNELTEDTSLQPGLCPLTCGRLGFFVLVLAICLFLTGVIQNPLIMVTMRSVSHHERAFALGLQFVIIRLLANLPSPMVFGRVIDEACLFWRPACGRRGDCAFVDVRALNLYVTSLGITIKGSGFILYFLLFYLLRFSSSNQTAGQSGFARKPSGPMSGPRASQRRTTLAIQ